MANDAADGKRGAAAAAAEGGNTAEGPRRWDAEGMGGMDERIVLAFGAACPTKIRENYQTGKGY